MSIPIVERRDAKLSNYEWNLIAQDANLRTLGASNILTAALAGDGHWMLRAGNHVGKTVLGGISVKITEKVPGAFSALAQILTPSAFLMSAAPSPTSPSTDPEIIFVRMLISAARSYLSGAMLLDYKSISGTGAYVSGRLDPRKTATLRAKGIRHKVAFSRFVLTDDVPLNASVYAALGEVLKVAQIIGLTPSDVSATRTVRAGFGECIESAGDAKRAHLVATALLEADATGRRREVTEVAALSAAVLQAATLATDDKVVRTLPRSWFINIETFFEHAVRLCISDALLATARVSGPINRPPLFPSVLDRFRANPDVVIRTSDEIVLADAKYKDFNGWPSSPDVFELLSHAAAYGASKAFLVYPSDGGYQCRDLGVSASGCRVWAFALPFSDFRGGIVEALTRLDLHVATAAVPLMAA